MPPVFTPPPFPGFGSQLRNPMFSDITLVVGASAVSIPCHRLIIAEHSLRLAPACADPHTRELVISRWEPETIQLVLQYLYTGSVDYHAFDTMMVVYECAKDLEIGCLMEHVIYMVVLGGGRWEVVMSDTRMLTILLEKIFSLTREVERGKAVYRRVFTLLAAVVQQQGLMKEVWFTDLMRSHSGLAPELLRAVLLGEDETGRIGCFHEGCDEIIGEWRKCYSCAGSADIWDAESALDDW
ncbi:hypothetical protein TWF696_003487 [Orbilia brochopaga]|uniref:BTB domain-containing protein n=1 Tax=Orbilia brochopaga TaxID=3140254 RepID=A0AAV9TX00_9PEZI